MSLFSLSSKWKMRTTGYQVGVLSVFAFDYGLQDFRLHNRISIQQEFGKQLTNVVLPIAKQDHRFGTFELDHIAFVLVGKDLSQQVNGRVVAHFEYTQMLWKSFKMNEKESGV